MSTNNGAPAKSPSDLTVSLDGVTMLPTGHVATVKTYLRCVSDHSSAPPLPEGMRLVRLRGGDEARYRRLFLQLGQRWLWWSRLKLSPAQLAAILDAPQIEAQAVVADGEDIGLLEWDFHDAGEPELAFLGLTDAWHGRNLGRSLVGLTLARLLARASAVRVNTCTFDSPRALALYIRCGFEPVSQAIEIVPDPRRSGLLPADAAPHIPMIGPAARAT